jgi:hypothetical protein
MITPMPAALSALSPIASANAASNPCAPAKKMSANPCAPAGKKAGNPCAPAGKKGANPCAPAK